MHLLIGLGNPGEEYQQHRHNVGFQIIDAVSEKYSFPSFSSKFRALFSMPEIGQEKVILFKPQTFMNLSGQAVHEVVRFYKLQPEQLIVFHDDLDLKVGQIKIKQAVALADIMAWKALIL